MNKELKYGGYTAQPSDYLCPDGQFDCLINLANTNGSLSPQIQPETIGKSPLGYSLKYIHNIPGSTRSNYIFASDTDIAFGVKADNGDFLLVSLLNLAQIPQKTLLSVNSIGNILLAICSDGMYHFLWKPETSAYKQLGRHLPEIDLSFGLHRIGIKSSDEFEVKFQFDKNDFDSDGWANNIPEQVSASISNQVMGQVNKYLSDNVNKKGKFLYPFFVRYALRLYDGSLTCHSAPVLMLPSMKLAPYAYWTEASFGNDGNAVIKSKISGIPCGLDYALKSSSDTLTDFKDIISSVDVFISQPFYTYDQAGKIEGFRNQADDDAVQLFLAGDCGYDSNDNPIFLNYRYRAGKQFFERNPVGSFKLPQKDISEQIRNCANFYLLKSFKLDELSTSRCAIDIPDDYLASLVAREVMTDDYDSHDTLLPTGSFSFNSRLNLYGLKKIIYNGASPASAIPYCDSCNDQYAQSHPNDKTSAYYILYYIRRNGKDFVTKAGWVTYGTDAPIQFLYHPDPNVYKVAIVTGSLSAYGTTYEFPMQRHAALNGSFFFSGFADTLHQQGSGVFGMSHQAADYTVVDIPDKLYLSEVNNPFHFPVVNINTLPVHTILGVSTAAKALSQGQFGQFPLYVFTSDGIWAMETNSTGSYSTRTPISRDVCRDAASITQLDSSVLFATDRGLMHISGSDIECISQSIDNDYPFDVTLLPHLQNIAKSFSDTDNPIIEVAPFSSFLTHCNIIYDYINQRLIISNPHFKYSYIFSMQSHSWAMIHSDIVDSVNSYPYAFATTSDGDIINFSTKTYSPRYGIAVTRPLKLDSPDTLKTIDTVIQRGHFHKGNVASILYGSRDLFNWHLIWSSKDHFLRGFRGTPYKYFRIAILCKLSSGENIHGASVQFSPRLINSPR